MAPPNRAAFTPLAVPPCASSSSPFPVTSPLPIPYPFPLSLSSSSVLVVVVVVYVYQEAYLSQFRIVISGFLTFVSLSPFPPLSLSVGISPKPKSEHPPVPYLRTVLRLIPLHGPPPASSIPEFPVFSSFSASSLKRLDLRGFHPLRFLPPKDSPLTVFVIFHFRPVSRF